MAIQPVNTFNSPTEHKPSLNQAVQKYVRRISLKRQVPATTRDWLYKALHIMTKFLITSVLGAVCALSCHGAAKDALRFDPDDFRIDSITMPAGNVVI